LYIVVPVEFPIYFSTTPHGGAEMRIISFVTEHPVIRQILEHL
jgi:hypothetical protein